MECGEGAEEGNFIFTPSACASVHKNKSIAPSKLHNTDKTHTAAPAIQGRGKIPPGAAELKEKKGREREREREREKEGFSHFFFHTTHTRAYTQKKDEIAPAKCAKTLTREA